MATTTWVEEAACTANPDRQFPEPSDHGGVHKARLVCRRCPVRDACLRDALDTSQEHGVWGGFTGPERARLMAGAHARPCVGCRLPFVPPNAKWERCSGCPTGDRGRLRGPNHRGASPRVAPHREAVERWAADGWNDVRIAAAIGVNPDAVRRARAVWGIRSGHRLAISAASNRRVRRRDEAAQSKSDAALAA